MHPAQLFYRFGEIRIIAVSFSLPPPLSSASVILEYFSRLRGKALCRVFSDKITRKTLSLGHFNDTAI
jgi:hypothetical protein